MIKKIKIKAIPFVADFNPDDIRNDILNDPQTFLNDKLTGSIHDFGVSSIMLTGVYKEMGYSYNFCPFLRLFVYNLDGQWYQVYALNKTNVRHLIKGRLSRITEVSQSE